ncbi:MAG: riboflavin synthase [Chthoniobacterales bacterium]
MFTGLIEEVGRVRWIRTTARGTQLRVAAPSISPNLRDGDSVAVNGCCLTTTTIRDGDLTFDLLEETIARTNLRSLGADSPVNLERALAATGRIGGHFVQGHIDCTVRVLNFAAVGTDYRLEVELPGTFAQYVVGKGSIALNGVSLTIAEVLPASVVVWIIPHTRAETNFRRLQPNDILNVEFDILAKYVERMLRKTS